MKFQYGYLYVIRTAKKFRFMYSQKMKLYGLSPNFHIHVSVSDLYIPTVHLFSCSRIGISWVYKNNSQKHECRNWDYGRAVLQLGIFVSNFRLCVFAVLIIEELNMKTLLKRLSNVLMQILHFLDLLISLTLIYLYIMKQYC